MRTQPELAKILLSELKIRRQKNTSYSLRAFAAWLELSPSSLSEIIAGKRQVSPKMARKLSERLKLPSEKTHKIIKSIGKRSWLPKKSNQSYIQLKKDQFELITSWVHFAILSLLKVDSPEKSIKWMSEKLSISETLAREATQRLIRLHLIAETRPNYFERTSNPISSSDGTLDLAIQKSHQETCDIARDSVTSFPVDERDFTSITMAIDPKKIPEAKQMIRAFRDRLSSVLEDGEVKDVYRLSIQLFPLRGKK
ncbi:MAG: TIGR02147 family protein [Oligoflexia bacterium]|nr:TIGR02147 family protein [Oligoflexia bacterium]